MPADRQWPDGRLGADDDGQIEVAIGSDMQRLLVVMQFASEVGWVALPAHAARAMAAALNEHADRVDEPLAIGVREAAKQLGVHENTMRNWAKSGLIEGIHLPGSGFLRFRQAEVDRLRKETT